MVEKSVKILERAAKLAERRWLLLAVAIALFFALRLPFLRSDPPPFMFHGFSTIELMVEPPAKSSEARNYALFGTFVPNEADNYRFWRAQSPLWVYPLAGVYRVFGVSYTTLRLFALAWSLVGMLALLGTARRTFAPVAVVAFVAFAVIDHVDAVYGRAGLLEPAVAAALSIGVAALVRANERVWWLIPAMLAFLAAFFVKQAAITALPALLVFGVVALVRARGVEKKWLARGAILVVAAALLGLLLFVVTRVDYQRTITWNYNHVLVGKGNNSSGIEAEDVLESNVMAAWVTLLHRLQGIGTIFLVTFPLAVATVVTTIVRGIRERRLDFARAVFSLWFVSALAALFITKPSGIRFLVLLGPPCIFLAAAKIDDFVQALPTWRAPLALTLGAAHLVYQCIGWGFVAANTSYDIVEAGPILEREIGPKKAVIIGQWAAPAVLETPYEQYYVKDVFNSDAERLDALGVTHTLLRKGDFTRSFLAPAAKKIVDGTPVVTIPFYRAYEVTLAEVPPAWFTSSGVPAAARRKPARK